MQKLRWNIQHDASEDFLLRLNKLHHYTAVSPQIKTAAHLFTFINIVQSNKQDWRAISQVQQKIRGFL